MFVKNMQGITYDQLDENEKVALTVAILFPHRTLSAVLPRLFKLEASDSTYYRYYRQGRDKLRERGMLDGEGFPTDMSFKVMPTSMLVQMTKDLSKELRLLDKEHREEESRARDAYKQVWDAKTEMGREMEALKEKFDFMRSYDELKHSLSLSLQNDIDAAVEMFRKGSYDSAIVKAYLASEVLGRNLFRLLYGSDEVAKVGKHENKLKKMWTDEQLEKRKHPGIQVIASLFSVILWYRNKMGAHKELSPSMEAARTCIVALLQAIGELKRLGFKDVIAS
jgi:hypothetical protein